MTPVQSLGHCLFAPVVNVPGVRNLQFTFPTLQIANWINPNNPRFSFDLP